MKFFLSALTLFSTMTTLWMTAPAQAREINKNYIGPSLTLTSGLTGFGAVGKYGVAENISIRPFAHFFSANQLTLAVYGAGATYDYTFPKSDITIYGGLGLAGATVAAGGQSYSGIDSGVRLMVGADYRVSDSLIVNLNSNLGYYSVGAGFNF